MTIGGKIHTGHYRSLRQVARRSVSG